MSELSTPIDERTVSNEQKRIISIAIRRPIAAVHLLRNTAIRYRIRVGPAPIVGIRARPDIYQEINNVD